MAVAQVATAIGLPGNERATQQSAKAGCTFMAAFRSEARAKAAFALPTGRVGIRSGQGSRGAASDQFDREAELSIAAQSFPQLELHGDLKDERRGFATWVRQAEGAGQAVDNEVDDALDLVDGPVVADFDYGKAAGEGQDDAADEPPRGHGVDAVARAERPDEG